MKAARQQQRSLTSSASDLAARHRRPAAPKRRAPSGTTRPRRAGAQSAPGSRLPVRHLVRAGLGLVVIVMVVAGIVGAYRVVASSRLFRLRHIDLQGRVRTPEDEVMRILRRGAAGGLWQVDVDELRATLKRQPWVREAEVACVLPDTLRVTISEREPYALARRSSGALVWVDREGVVLGEQAQFKPATLPPIIRGLDEGDGPEASEANRQRLLAYQQLLADLDQGPALSDRVDEIYLEDVEDIRLRPTDRRVMVVVGARHFRARLKSALDILEAIDRRDLSALQLLRVTDAKRLAEGGRIAYLNTTHEGRVVVGLAP